MADTPTPNAGAAPSPIPSTTQTPAAKQPPKSFKDLDSEAIGKTIDAIAGTPGAAVLDPDPPADADSDDELGDLEEADEPSGQEEDIEEEDEEEDEEDQEESEPAIDKEALSKKILEELGEDGRLSVKVDGQQRRFTWDEIKRVVSSGTHNSEWRRKEEQRLGGIQNKLVTDLSMVSVVNQRLQPAWQEVEKGNIEGAIISLAEVSGKNGLEVKKSLISQMMPVICARLGITKEWAEQRMKERSEHIRMMDIAEENEFLKRTTTRLEENQRQPKAGKPSPRELVLGAAHKYSVAPQDIDKTAKFLLQEEFKGREKELTLDIIGARAAETKIVERAIDALMSVSIQHAKGGKVRDRVLRRAMQEPSLTIPELAQIARKLIRKEKTKLREKEAETLTRDISGKALQGRDKAAFQTLPSGQKKPLSFKDLHGEP